MLIKEKKEVSSNVAIHSLRRNTDNRIQFLIGVCFMFCLLSGCVAHLKNAQNPSDAPMDVPQKQSKVDAHAKQALQAAKLKRDQMQVAEQAHKKSFTYNLTSANIANVVSEHKYELKPCYQSSESKASNRIGDSGTMLLWWQIDSKGEVEQIRIIDNETGNRKLAKCLTRHIASWDFSEDQPIAPTSVKFPFELKYVTR